MADVKINVGVDEGSSMKTLDSLETKMESLKDSISGVEVGSEEFNKLSQEISQTQTEVKNLELGMEGLDMEQKSTEMGSFAAGMADTATGALALSSAMGITNESSEEMIESMVSGMAVAQTFRGGLDGIISAQRLLRTSTVASTAANQINTTTLKAGNVATKTNSSLMMTNVTAQKSATVATKGATIAQRVLNAVMKANPIMLLVGAVTAAIGAFALFSMEASNAEKKQEAYNESMKAAIDSSKEELTALEDLNDVVKDGTTSREELTGAIDELQDKYPGLLDNIDKENISREKLSGIIENNTRLTLLNAQKKEIQKQKQDLVAQSIQETTDAQTGENVAWYDSVNALQASVLGLEDYNSAKKIANERTRQNKEEINKEEKALKELEDAIQDEIDKRNKRNKILENESELRGIVADIHRERRRDAMTSREKDLDDLRESYEKKLSLARKVGENEALIIKEWQRQVEKINAEHRDEQTKKGKSVLEKRQDELKKQFVEKQTLLIQQLKNEEITEDEFDRRSLQNEKEKLEKEKKALIKAGEETFEIKKQIAEKELELSNLGESGKGKLDKELEDIRKWGVKKQTLLTNMLRKEKLTKEEFQAQQDILEFERLKKEKAALEQAGRSTVDVDKKIAEAKLNISKQTSDKNVKIKEDEEEAKKKIRGQQVAGAIEASDAVLGAVAQAAGEGTAVAKAAGVAQATIDTYKAAQGAYASLAGIPVVGPGLGAAAAAAAVAMGAMNVKKILSTPTPGSGGSGGSGSGNISAAKPQTQQPEGTPDVNLFGNANKGSEGDASMFNTKDDNGPKQVQAVVQWSDIESVQSADNNIQNEMQL